MCLHFFDIALTKFVEQSQPRHHLGCASNPFTFCITFKSSSCTIHPPVLPQVDPKHALGFGQFFVVSLGEMVKILKRKKSCQDNMLVSIVVKLSSRHGAICGIRPAFAHFSFQNKIFSVQRPYVRCCKVLHTDVATTQHGMRMWWKKTKFPQKKRMQTLHIQRVFDGKAEEFQLKRFNSAISLSWEP